MRRRLTGSKSPILALGTIAASSLFLSGCGEDPADGDVLFTSVGQCMSSGVGAQLCWVAYQDAMRAHLTSAPRFTNKTSCEAEYGAGQCVEQETSTVPGNKGSTGNFFVPFLAGFVLSSAINNATEYYSHRRRQEEEASSGDGGGGGYYGSSAVYRSRSGAFVTPASRPSVGEISVGTSQQTVKPVNVNTRTVARQGFGGHSIFSFGG